MQMECHPPVFDPSYASWNSLVGRFWCQPVRALLIETGKECEEAPSKRGSKEYATSKLRLRVPHLVTCHLCNMHERTRRSAEEYLIWLYYNYINININMMMTIIHERMTPGGDGWKPAIFAESRASWHICIIVYLYRTVYANKTYDQSINQSCLSLLLVMKKHKYWHLVRPSFPFRANAHQTITSIAWYPEHGTRNMVGGGSMEIVRVTGCGKYASQNKRVRSGKLSSRFDAQM